MHRKNKILNSIGFYGNVVQIIVAMTTNEKNFRGRREKERVLPVY
jgi:hypothetical protein